MSSQNSTTTVDLSINGQQAKETLNQLRVNAQNLETAIAKAAAAGNKADLKKLRKELTDTKKQIKEMESSTQSVDRVMRNLNKATPKELNSTLATLKRQLNNIERGSAAWNEHVKKIQAVKAEITSMNAQLQTQQGLFGRIGSTLSKWSGAIMGGMAATAGITMAVNKAVDAFAEQEKQLMNVTNTTALTGDALKRVNDELAKMQTTTSQIDLLKLAEEAGEMGYRTEEEIVAYVKAADQVKVAMGDLGEESVKTFGKIAKVFGVDKEMGTEQSLLAVASTVDVLGQNCEASKADIAAFLQGISGVGSAADMTIPELTAFSAVLQSNGQEAKNSSSVLSKLINDLNKDPGKFAKALGVSVDELNKKFENTTEGLVWFFDTLNKRGDADAIAPLLKEMGEGGAKAAGVINTLAGNIDELKMQINNANVAFQEASNVTNEYNNINSTFAAQQEIQKKKTQELLVTLGEQLAPVVGALRTAFNALLTVISTIITFMAKYKGVILTVTAAIVAYKAQVLLTANATKLWQGAVALFTNGLNKAKTAMIALGNAMKANPWGFAIAAIAAIVTGLISWANESKKVNQIEKDRADIMKQVTADTATEIEMIDREVQLINAETTSQNERVAALERLRQKIGDSNLELDAHNKLTADSINLIEQYKQSLLDQAEMNAISSKIQDIMKENLEIEDKKNELKAKKDDGFLGAIVGNVVEHYKGAIDEGFDQLLKSNEARIKSLNDRLYALQRRQRTRAATIEPTYTYTGGGGGATAAGRGGAGAIRTTPTRTGRTGRTGTGRTTSGNAGSGNKSEESYLQKATREHEDAIRRLQLAYQTGQQSYDEYLTAMEREDKRYYDDVTKNAKVANDDRLKLSVEYEDKKAEYESKRRAKSLDELEDDYKAEMIAVKQHYADGELTTDAYNETLNLMELEYLDRRRGMLKEQMAAEKEGTERRMELERQYADANEKYLEKVIADQQDKQQRMAELEKKEAEERAAEEAKHQQDLQNIRDKYYGVNAARAKSEFDRQMALLDEQKAIELAEVEGLANADAEKLRIEEAYQKARLALMRQYNQIQQADNTNFLQDWVASSQKWLESDLGQAVTKSLSVISNGMQSVFSQMSNIISAEAEIQTAKMEAYYERQLSLAEGNRYKEVQLEKEKKEKIAKIKSDAEKKKYKMEVIAAIAQTATAAINAYSSAAAVPLVGYILAPIAAATAIAAGMLQVQALKKQQQASDSQGYAEGGFTPEGLPNTPAGIVHAGEWVASQRLTRNPHVRPILEALDDVQRNNRIGTLNAGYVTRSINAPTVLADSYQQSQGNSRRVFVENQPESSNGAISEYAEVIRQLKERLDEPFVTVNSVTGDTGMKQAQDEYDRLIRNKSPKSR